MEPAHLESLRRFLHRQESHARRQRQEIEERLHRLLPSFTRRFPEVERLWVIGSFTDPRFFSAASDVDIVMGGEFSNCLLTLLNFLDGEQGMEEPAPETPPTHARPGRIEHRKERPFLRAFKDVLH